jgi:hypothetical protein
MLPIYIGTLLGLISKMAVRVINYCLAKEWLNILADDVYTYP